MKPAGREMVSVSFNNETSGVSCVPTPIGRVSSRAQLWSQALGQALSGMCFWGKSWLRLSTKIIVQWPGMHLYFRVRVALIPAANYPKAE